MTAQSKVLDARKTKKRNWFLSTKLVASAVCDFNFFKLH